MTPEPEVFECEAGICKRVQEGGAQEFRAITSDSDHLMVKGLHYHLHCAPPAVQTDQHQQFIAEPEPPAEGLQAVEELITRVTRYVEEAPQIEREPLLYRAHVLGVLHQAQAMERIAEVLESLDITADRIFNEVLKPGGEPHEFMPHTGGGKECYACGMPFDHKVHGRVEGGE